jgi:hypothetical protein
MTRIVVAFFVAFSLAFGGVANAMAAHDCPFLRVASSIHDCCPLTGKHQDKSSDKDSKSQTCKLGQACRSIPAMAPSLLETRVTLPMVRDDGPAITEPTTRPSPLFSFWRPPRAA